MTAWMLLEDEPDLYDMVLAMYGLLGIKGIAFTNGEDAFSWLDDVENGRYRQEMPELALLDIRMPDRINGPMVGARIRQSPALRDIVIVLMTAYKLTPQEEEEIMMYSGADYFLYKPLPALPEIENLFRSLIAERAH